MLNNQLLSANFEATANHTRIHVHSFAPTIMHHMADDPRCEFFSLNDATHERKMSVGILMNRAELLAMHATLTEFVEKLPSLSDKLLDPTPAPEPAAT
jgi:hypothetical protein